MTLSVLSLVGNIAALGCCYICLVIVTRLRDTLEVANTIWTETLRRSGGGGVSGGRSRKRIEVDP